MQKIESNQKDKPKKIKCCFIFISFICFDKNKDRVRLGSFFFTFWFSIEERRKKRKKTINPLIKCFVVFFVCKLIK
jgi:hypothetical protein